MLASGCAEADRRIDLAEVDGEAALQPLIELVQHLARLGHGAGIAGDGDLIAARHQRDAEALLDAREMAVVLAEQHRQQPIVVELQDQGLGDAGRGHDGQAPATRLGAAARPAR